MLEACVHKGARRAIKEGRHLYAAPFAMEIILSKAGEYCEICTDDENRHWRDVVNYLGLKTEEIYE